MEQENIVGFNWSKIHYELEENGVKKNYDGFRAFEYLAVLYVNSVMPPPKNKNGEEHNWNKTPETRDGNKDALVLISFNDCEHKWWMEAKYSTQQTRLSRYRMDATIVSGLIEGGVKKIVFITNIDMELKTKNDLRIAARTMRNCEVSFVTKYVLENWLRHNKDICLRFFDNIEYAKISNMPTHISSHAQIYSRSLYSSAFCEDNQSLVAYDKSYLAEFSVYSDKQQTVKICSKSPYIKLNIGNQGNSKKIKREKNIELLTGANDIQIDFNVERYNKKCKKGSNSNTKIKDDETSIQNSKEINKIESLFEMICIEEKNKKFAIGLENGDLSIVDNEFCYIEIKKQREIIEKLLNSLNTNIAKTFMCSCLFGESGLGKSLILEKFLESYLNKNFNNALQIFFDSFPKGEFEQEQKIADLIIFLYFPCVYPEKMDVEYLEKLWNKRNSITALEFLKNLVASRLDYDKLKTVFMNFLQREQSFFPTYINIAPRIIVLDDVHRLNDTCRKILFQLIKELKEKKAPVFICISAWGLLRNTEEYEEFKCYVAPEEIKYILQSNDYLDILKNTSLASLGFSDGLDSYFANLIELFGFLNMYNYTLKDRNIHDFFIAYREYSDVRRGIIIDRFCIAFSRSDTIKELCDKIYWAFDGIQNTSSNNKFDVETLLSLGLIVKKGDKLYPSHDYYQSYYQNNFKRPQLNIKIDEMDDNARYNMLLMNYNIDESSIEEIVTAIENKCKNKEYYSVLFILEVFFSNLDPYDSLKNRIGEKYYYRLYIAYAFGVINKSKSHNGFEICNQIIKETKKITDKTIVQIYNTALYETINSCFEHLRFTDLEERVGLLDESLRHMQKRGQIDDMNAEANHIKAKFIYALMSTELKKDGYQETFANAYNTAIKYASNDNDYEYNALIFKLRYLETQYCDQHGVKVLEDIIKIRDEFEKYGSEEKFYLWSKMDTVYLKYINGIDKNWDDLIDIHNAFQKNYYNDFKKRSIAMASIAYYIGDSETGDRYLIKDMANQRGIRPRLQAFFHETLALKIVVECHKNSSANLSDAIDELSKAKVIFKELPDYVKIIDHNIKLVEHIIEKCKCNIPCNIEFYTGGEMKSDIYYIDSRCIW